MATDSASPRARPRARRRWRAAATRSSAPACSPRRPSSARRPAPQRAPQGGVRRHGAHRHRQRARAHRAQLRPARHRQRREAPALRLQRLHRAEDGDGRRGRLLAAPVRADGATGFDFATVPHHRGRRLPRGPALREGLRRALQVLQGRAAAAARGAPRRGCSPSSRPARRCATSRSSASASTRRAAPPTSTTAASATTSSPPSHDFEWTRATRENHVLGRHPHVNILDTVFVETVAATSPSRSRTTPRTARASTASRSTTRTSRSTTPSSPTRRSAPSSSCASCRSARQTYRYLVFNTRTQHVVRIDAIGQACVRLPEDHGIIFPGGYYLQTGDHKVFEATPSAGLEFERGHPLAQRRGRALRLPPPRRGHVRALPVQPDPQGGAEPARSCHGYRLFADGRMVVFRAASNEPTRVHPMQVWQTPFASAEHAAATPAGCPGYLGKVGNAELVRGISDALTLRGIAEVRASRPAARYEDLVASATRATRRVLLARPRRGGAPGRPWRRCAAPPSSSSTSSRRCSRSRSAPPRRSPRREATQQALLLEGPAGRARRPSRPSWTALTALRQQRGQLITLKEIRYIDLRAARGAREAGRRGVRPRQRRVRRLPPDGRGASSPCAERAGRAARRSSSRCRRRWSWPRSPRTSSRWARASSCSARSSAGSRSTTRRRARRSSRASPSVLPAEPRARRRSRPKRKELVGREKRAEFGAQFKLFAPERRERARAGDTPEKCDEELVAPHRAARGARGPLRRVRRVPPSLAQKREEVLEAFGARKQALVDERQRRAQNLFGAAERILEGVRAARRRSRATTSSTRTSPSDADGPEAARSSPSSSSRCGQRPRRRGALARQDGAPGRAARRCATRRICSRAASARHQVRQAPLHRQHAAARADAGAARRRALPAPHRHRLLRAPRAIRELDADARAVGPAPRLRDARGLPRRVPRRVRPRRRGGRRGAASPSPALQRRGDATASCSRRVRAYAAERLRRGLRARRPRRRRRR